jgi:hypothetical protein
MYPKNNLWTRSSFMSDVQHLNWKIPQKYVLDPQPECDLCWCKVEDDYNDDYITIPERRINLPERISIFFRQPYDVSGNWIPEPSALGVIDAIVYSPPGDRSGDMHLFEALDVGFRGMSGAVGLRDDTTELVGMFVKRGSLIQLKQKNSIPPKNYIPENHSIPSIFEEATRKNVIPASKKHYTIVQTFFRSLLGLDLMEKSIDDRFHEMTKSIDERFDDLTSIVLQKKDLKELGAVFDARRGIFLSADAIRSLLREECVSVKDVENTPSPSIASQ